jgi:hypothetical protein
LQPAPWTRVRVERNMEEMIRVAAFSLPARSDRETPFRLPSGRTPHQGAISRCVRASLSAR